MYTFIKIFCTLSKLILQNMFLVNMHIGV